MTLPFIVFWKEETADDDIAEEEVVDVVQEYATQEQALAAIRLLFEDEGVQANLARVIPIEFTVQVAIKEGHHVQDTTEATSEPTDAVHDGSSV